MTTRAIVPNGDGEGSLGTSTAKWGAVYSSDPVSGENSGQVPTTAWVQKLLADALAKQKAAYEQAISTAVSAAQTKAKLDAHPVGSYYFSDKSTSPADLFGGTWEALPAGYTLIAQGSGTDDYGSFTYTAGQKYGERKHKLTTDELPKISGSVSSLMRWNTGKTQSGVLKAVEGTSKFPSTQSENVSNSTVSIEFGGDKPHENLSPCVAAYGWRRTA
ncbi:phage baseplate protein [Acidaminococcus intestini]|uniref:phage baseplate protein n=1 Tax=Acidaminococcus intestini TaxID=187327 RepID=UPI003A835240